MFVSFLHSSFLHTCVFCFVFCFCSQLDTATGRKSDVLARSRCGSECLQTYLASFRVQEFRTPYRISSTKLKYRFHLSFILSIPLGL